MCRENDFMSLDILITVAITSIIQSIFGVGVLLFGTPVLLALGYDFNKSIIILLPISLTINFFQVAKDYKSIDTNFYKKILVYTIPFVVVFLFLVTTYKINIGLYIGICLLLIAIKDYSTQVKRAIGSLIRQERICFVALGIIHGLTNLGGSLLMAIVHNKNYEKRVTRVTVAASYATFAIFQITTLLFSTNRTNIHLLEIGTYLIVGFLVFMLMEKTVFISINNKKYSDYFATFLFLVGLLLCITSI